MQAGLGFGDDDRSKAEIKSEVAKTKVGVDNSRSLRWSQNQVDGLGLGQKHLSLLLSMLFMFRCTPPRHPLPITIHYRFTQHLSDETLGASGGFQVYVLCSALHILWGCHQN
jgi:hypothetical protein